MVYNISKISYLRLHSASLLLPENILYGIVPSIGLTHECSVTFNSPTIDFSYSFDGRNVYFTIKNTSYDLSAAKVDIAMNIKATSTTGSYLPSFSIRFLCFSLISAMLDFLYVDYQ